MKILGPGQVTLDEARAWATAKGAHQRMIAVAWHYWDKAGRYGIPPEIAYCQAAKETNWGKFTGVVPSTYHNWAGIKTRQGGSNTSASAHQQFESDSVGVLAHLQHLFRYAGGQAAAAGDELVDPRWSVVTKFTDTVEGLGKAWAPSPTYGQEVVKIVDDLLAFAASHGEPPMTAQIPGFIWHPADADHYDRGRTEKIRGGAQHYTAGTNSLAWLTKTSSPPVSVHFLVKHNPTMEDRGWQLVPIEDTAWTTAFANPYTVAIEYEHDGKQEIPDIAYEVLAQTWVDIKQYVKAHDLGNINTVAGHKVWVENPRLICPDGINVDRIEKRMLEILEPPPADLTFDGIKIVLGFKGFWEELAGYEPTLPFRVLGYPLANEVSGGDGIAYQEFERGWLKWSRSEPAPWHITLAHKGDHPEGVV